MAGTPTTEWLLVAIGAIDVLIVPMLALVFRITIKWSRTESSLNNLIDDVKELVITKDKIHAEILEQMRHDRDTTDKRLRFMEEFWMRRGIDNRGTGD